MNRFLLGLFMAFAITMSANAQQVFTEIRNKAQATVSDPNTAVMVRQINQFKVDALNYMAMKMREVMPDSSATYLDRQAYAMHTFLTLYMKTMLAQRTAPQKIQIEHMKLFIDASISNPLFRDNDHDLVLAYYAESDCITRFSLDTDWQRAYIAVATEMKKIR